MDTEIFEGLYVPSAIFNSHYTMISSFVTTQVRRWVWKKKNYIILKISSFWMCLTHWGPDKMAANLLSFSNPFFSNEKNIFDSDFTESFSDGSY